MATASSAQREPSMEEILASIRRIIEDSDGGRKPVEAAESILAAEDAAGEMDSPDVEEFRMELRAGNPESEPRKPVSLAEVQAQVASGRPSSAARDVASSIDPAPARAVTLAEVGARLAAERGDDTAPAAVDAVPFERNLEAPAAPKADESPILHAESHAGEPQIEIDDADLVLQDESDPEPAAQSAVLRPSLVSEQTSRQVAAAFGELSEAFASRSKKSFDEMAEEMLRPMLQDWLDNNLPTLVERLVREEIERVARGGA
jgi:cell pole-organizing protein PopZ